MNRRSSRTTNRRKISKRAKRAKRLFTGFICALIICVSGSAFLVSAQGLSDHDTHTYYKSIEIQKGDTLWDIARQTKPADCGSTAEYVQVLKDMNRLGSDDIQSGRHLIVACNMWSIYFIFRYQYTSPCIDILTPSKAGTAVIPGHLWNSSCSGSPLHISIYTTNTDFSKRYGQKRRIQL